METQWIIGIAITISVITEILKKLPKVPVNKGNAIYVVFVLAIIGILVPAYLGGSLTLTNTDTLVAGIVAAFGIGTGLYVSAKRVIVWIKDRSTKK